MSDCKIIAACCAAAIYAIALVGQVAEVRAEVQGLDDLYGSRRDRGRADAYGNRSWTGGCRGGSVEGLRCRGENPGLGSPDIEGSDQGWQRDWRDFGAGDPGITIYGYEGGPYPGPRWPPRFGPPPLRDYGGGDMDGPPRGLGLPYWAPR